MADKDFVVKNGLVVNTNFSVNSTILTHGTYLSGCTSSFAIGSSSVYVNTGILYSNNLLLKGDNINGYVKPINTSSHLYLGANNSDYVILAANGNFGIGNLVPTTKLSVQGTTYLYDDVTILKTITDKSGSKGTVGSVLLSGGASGNVYWGGPPSSVAGSDTWVQFNDNGALGANGSFAYLKTGNTLSLANGITTGGSVYVNGTATVNISLVVTQNVVTIGSAAYHVANGNFGINTNTPDYKFTVSGSSYHYGGFSYFNGKTNTNYPDTNSGMAIGSNASGSQSLDIWNTSDTTFTSTGILFVQRLSGSTRRDLMFLKNDGAVGIGCTAPTSTLHITNNAPSISLQTSASTFATIDYDTNRLKLASLGSSGILFSTNATGTTIDRGSFSSSGNFYVGSTSTAPSTGGVAGFRYIDVQNMQGTGTSGAGIRLLTAATAGLGAQSNGEIYKTVSGSMVIKNTETDANANLQLQVAGKIGLSIDVNGNATVPTGNFYTKKFFDLDNTAYYIDPNDLSVANVFSTQGTSSRIYATYDATVVGGISAASWFTSQGGTGWTDATNGGGIYMTDTAAVRVYTASGTKKKFIGENNFETTRFVAAPTGTTSDQTYNGTFMSTAPASSGQHINMVRSGNQAWSLGYVYNTSNFGLGAGKTADTDFTGANIVFAATPGGNVGIGTTSPYSKLNISSSTDTTFTVNSTSSGSAWILGNAPNGLILHNVTSTPTIFTTNGTERMRIDASGNMGIGTTSPSSPGGTINLVTSSNNITVVKSQTSSTTTGYARFDLATGTASSYTLIALQDNTGAPYFQLASGSGVLNNYYDGPNHIWRNATGTERMRIDSSGNVGIGTVPTGGYKLEVSSNANVTGYNDIALFKTTNNSGGTNFTRFLIGQTSTNVIHLEAADQSNTKGKLELQPYGGITAIGPSGALYVDSSGKVGVGTSTPYSLLTTFNNQSYSTIETGQHGFQTLTGTTSSDYTLFMGSDKTNGLSYIQSVQWATNKAPLILNGQGGNVGIGTSSPGYKLDVSGSGDVARLTSSTTSSGILMTDSSGIIRVGTRSGAAIFDVNSSERMRIDASGNVGIGTSSPKAPLVITPSAFNPSGTITPNKIRLYDDGANNVYGVGISGGQMDIIAAGSIYFHNTVLASNTTYAMGYFTPKPYTGTTYNGSTLGVVGDILATQNITAYYSDRRLKENVTIITDAVEKVKSLNGIQYTPNDLAASFGYDKSTKLVGLFADEVEAVLPEAVQKAPFDTDKNGNSITGENYKTIQYEKIVPLLVEAIKELKAEIEQLKGSR